MKRTLKPAIVLLLLTLMGSHVNAQERTYFRYKNDQGVQVMSDAIPVEYATKGYQIVNIYGRVIKEIPPELSQEEKQRLREEIAEKERLKQWDEELLSRYSNVEDIKAAQKRKLRGIDTTIFTLRLTLNNIQNKIVALQGDAAASERQGSEVSTDMLDTIEQLQKDLQLINEEIAQRQNDKKDVADSYQRDIERFEQIRPKRS